MTEQRLIDANAIPESATAISTDGRLYVAWSEIVKAPTVDAVPVVRCKDCKWSEDYRGVMLCNSPCGVFGKVKEDSFCSYGERRTDNG